MPNDDQYKRYLLERRKKNNEKYKLLKRVEKIKKKYNIDPKIQTLRKKSKKHDSLIKYKDKIDKQKELEGKSRDEHMKLRELETKNTRKRTRNGQPIMKSQVDALLFRLKRKSLKSQDKINDTIIKKK